jgi:hypothetical protein
MRIAAVLGIAVAVLVTGARLEAVDVAVGKHTHKHADAAPPKELKEPIRSLLESKSHQIYDPKDQLYCEIWFRKSIPVKATPEQVKTGLTYQVIQETMVIGAIRFHKEGHDYRKQAVKPGVYTLRMALQPQDGNHMGTAPHAEFLLLATAELDAKPEPMDVKALFDLSMKSMGGKHPGPLLMFPPTKPEPSPKVVDHGMGHWVLKHTLQAEVDGKPTPLPISLTVVGHSLE